MLSDDLSRAVMLWLERDGTLHILPIRDKKSRAVRDALPVFSVDTEEEAQQLRTRFCRHRWDGSWAWTDFGGELEHLEQARDHLRATYAAHRLRAVTTA